MKEIGIWAHRGASGYAPENTMEAFELAVQMGADGIELDVQLTKDDEVVVIHDEILQRVSNGTGYVKDYTLEQLRQFNFNQTCPKYDDVKIPTLREVLQLLADTDLALNIELKTGRFFYSGIEQKVLKLAKEYGMQDRVWYSSFNHYSMKRIKELSPQAHVGLLYCDGIYEPAAYAVQLGADALHPSIANLQYSGFMEKCRENGLNVHPWTANSYQDMEICMRMQVNAMITNYPDKGRIFMSRQGDGRFPFENPFDADKSRSFCLFGAGYNGQHFLKRFAGKYVPVKLVDNDASKWGQTITGILIESPACLKKDDCVIVAGTYFAEIADQLKSMGITSYYFYDEMCSWT